jgi:3-deoxy-D-arabino-heptulosonate 7-phosphate (DAHP) synthase class II
MRSWVSLSSEVTGDHRTKPYRADIIAQFELANKSSHRASRPARTAFWIAAKSVTLACVREHLFSRVATR